MFANLRTLAKLLPLSPLATLHEAHQNMRMIGIPLRSVSLAIVCFAASVDAQPRRVVPLGSKGKRVAMVVGNDSYRSLPRLSNGVRDARAVAAALTEAGFLVITLTDATREYLDEGIDKFIAAIQPGDIALFYYSGHAVQIGGLNYLSPIDLSVANEVQARTRSLNAGEVVEQMESKGADLQIVILDACRNNPFGRERGIGSQGGLASMNAGRGTFLAFATAPGKTADDNSGGSNGLYTGFLIQALRQPGLSIEEVFKQAGGQVQRASGGKQVPWISSSMDGQFYFRPVGDAPALPAVDVDLEMYAAV